MLRLEAVVRDIRYACRSLARRPGFAIVAVMTLAVGMGTMTVAFSAVNAFFLAGPPINAPGAGLIAVTGGAPEDRRRLLPRIRGIRTRCAGSRRLRPDDRHAQPSPW